MNALPFAAVSAIHMSSGLSCLNVDSACAPWINTDRTAGALTLSSQRVRQSSQTTTFELGALSQQARREDSPKTQRPQHVAEGAIGTECGAVPLCDFAAHAGRDQAQKAEAQNPHRGGFRDGI